MEPDLNSESTWEDSVEPEWLEWYGLSMGERWLQSCELWSHYLSLGGSLDPDTDEDSPFWSAEERAEFARNSAPRLITMMSRSGI